MELFESLRLRECPPIVLSFLLKESTPFLGIDTEEPAEGTDGLAGIFDEFFKKKNLDAFLSENFGVCVGRLGTPKMAKGALRRKGPHCFNPIFD